jgi:hypothetical protein
MSELDCILDRTSTDSMEPGHWDRADPISELEFRNVVPDLNDFPGSICSSMRMPKISDPCLLRRPRRFYQYKLLPDVTTVPSLGIGSA